MWEIMFKEKYTYAKEDLFWYIYAVAFGAWNIGMVVRGIIEGEIVAIVTGSIVFLLTIVLSYAMVRVYNSQRIVKRELDKALQEWRDSLEEFKKLNKDIK